MKTWAKYLGLILGSLGTAAISMVIDGIRDDQRANEIAEMAAEKAAKKAVQEYVASQPRMNRAQRRGH